MSKGKKLNDLVVISNCVVKSSKHASSFLELMAPPYCFHGMYSLHNLMYKVQDYNMEYHCNEDWLAHMRYGSLKMSWR